MNYKCCKIIHSCTLLLRSRELSYLQAQINHVLKVRSLQNIQLLLVGCRHEFSDAGAARAVTLFFAFDATSTATACSNAKIHKATARAANRAAEVVSAALEL